MVDKLVMVLEAKSWVRGYISPQLHTLVSAVRKAEPGILAAATACPQRQARMHPGAQLGIHRYVHHLFREQAGCSAPYAVEGEVNYYVTSSESLGLFLAELYLFLNLVQKHRVRG